MCANVRGNLVEWESVFTEVISSSTMEDGPVQLSFSNYTISEVLCIFTWNKSIQLSKGSGGVKWFTYGSHLVLENPLREKCED